MNRAVVATVVLLVPLVVTLPGTIRSELSKASAERSLTPLARAVEPPFHWPGDANARLLAELRARVPRDATIAFRSPDPRYVERGWVRWVAFVLAPRRIVEGRDADWLVVVGGAPPAGARRAWRFGGDWLVER